MRDYARTRSRGIVTPVKALVFGLVALSALVVATVAVMDVETIPVYVECGEGSEDDASGWRAFLTVDNELATYCPACAQEEFG